MTQPPTGPPVRPPRPPKPPEPPAIDPMTGPYDADTYGRCAALHPVNGAGRCEVLNDTGVCP